MQDNIPLVPKAQSSLGRKRGKNKMYNYKTYIMSCNKMNQAKTDTEGNKNQPELLKCYHHRVGNGFPTVKKNMH